MNSIVYRIAGLIFLLLLVTVVILVYMANHQMTGLFEAYVTRMPMHGMMHGFSMPHGMGHMAQPWMGQHERDFLESVHQSLLWVGAFLIMAGLLASVFLARSITVPLRRLNQAVRGVEAGVLEQHVPVTTKDEVGRLAMAFNQMSKTLQSNKEKRRRFLADVVHELRTPLSVIQGNLEGMMEGVVHTDKEELQSLYEETRHLNRLIGDLRDLSLAEAGQLAIDRHPAQLEEILRQAMDAVKPLTDKKGIILESHLTALPELSLDGGRIHQVAHNLLSNAIRYTPQGGHITVSSRRVKEDGKEWAAFSVEDTGEGIPAKDMPYIFDHFYRADTSRDRRKGGTGIGLSIVRQLTELHGGQVKAESTLGKGSRFTVYFPIVAKELSALPKNN